LTDKQAMFEGFTRTQSDKANHRSLL